MKKHKWLLYSGIIAVCFLWTGTAYISQVYRLFDFYDPSQVDIFSQVLYYFMQVLGLAAFFLLMKRYPDKATGHRTFTGIILAEAVVISIALTVNAPIVIVTAGFFLNFLHGLVAGYYLMLLSSYVPKEHRGKAFGFGYALGSIGTWAMGLPLDGKFLQSKYTVIVYLLLMALSIVMVKFAQTIPIENDTFMDETFEKDVPIIGNGLWKLVFLLIILLTFTKSVGFYFPLADVGKVVNVEFSRAFYAIGLIAAGVTNDKSRKYGAGLALISIIFPFIAIALNSNLSFMAAMWTLGYIFFGLMSVYRVIVFSDIAAEHRSLVPLAGAGLMAGRVGDLTGTLGGILCKNNVVSLLTVTGIAATILIPFFLSIYQRLYIPAITEEQSVHARYKDFEMKYHLSGRECEVFRLLMSGCSNMEVADKLFISESTVKFHVTNILRKTACHNRTEIIALFEK